MKKLHTHTCKKYHRTCPSTMTKSAKFFLFTVVFLQPFALSLLEPSTLSCKAACSLFRHHLHINAARELVGQHLMRR